MAQARRRMVLPEWQRGHADWQAINGKWYYLGTDGAMYADTWTPDGRYVDGSGAWVQ